MGAVQRDHSLRSSNPLRCVWHLRKLPTRSQSSRLTSGPMSSKTRYIPCLPIKPFMKKGSCQRPHYMGILTLGKCSYVSAPFVAREIQQTQLVSINVGTH
jgi:hypothetical protein